MSPNEIEVLRVFEKAESAGKGLLSKKLDVSTDYAEYLCKSLFRKGYLEALPRGQYRLKSKGLSALIENLSRILDECKQKMLFWEQQMEMTKLTLIELREREKAFQE